MPAGSEIADFLKDAAPMITALGAILLGILSHNRRNSNDEQAKFQRTIEELHGLYHNLVADLGEQVERVRTLNTDLMASNEALTNTVTELRSENATLVRTVKTLTRRVNALEKLERESEEK